MSANAKNRSTGPKVFISFRFDDAFKPPAYVGWLKSTIERELPSSKVVTLEGSQTNLGETQKRTILDCDVVFILLDKQRGLHSQPELKLGQQYHEVRALVEGYNEFGLENPEWSNDEDIYDLPHPWTKERFRQAIQPPDRMPHVVAIFLSEDGSFGRHNFEQFVLGDRTAEAPNAGVRSYLARCVAMEPVRWTGDDASETRLHEHFKASVKNVKSTLEEDADHLTQDFLTEADQTDAPFNIQRYLRRAKRIWRSGQIQKTAEAKASAFEGLPIDTPRHIRLRAYDEKREEIGRDAVRHIANSAKDIVFTGGAGSGKTSAIAHAALIEAETFGGGAENERLPLTFALRDLEFEDFDDVATKLASLLHYEEHPCDADKLTTLLRKQSCSLYFDDCQHLQDGDRKLLWEFLEELLDTTAAERMRFILCSPPDLRTLQGFEPEFVQLGVLEENDIGKFVEATQSADSPLDSGVFAQNLERLREIFVAADTQNFDKAQTDLIRTPLFLRLFLMQSKRVDAIGSPPLIFAQVLGALIDKQALEIAGETKLLKGEVGFLLSAIARKSDPSGRISNADFAAAISEQVSSREAREEIKLQLLRRSSLFDQVRSGVDLEDTVQFSHSLISSFLQAKTIALEFVEGRKENKHAQGFSILPVSHDEQTVEMWPPLVYCIAPAIIVDERSRGPSQSLEDCAHCAIELVCTTLDEIIRFKPSGKLEKDWIVEVLANTLDGYAAIRAFGEVISEELTERAKAAIHLAVEQVIAEGSIPMRHLILGKIADVDEALYHRAVPGLSALVPVPAELIKIEGRSLRFAASPVSVREYGEFAKDPGRYDADYWPHVAPDKLDSARALVKAGTGRTAELPLLLPDLAKFRPRLQKEWEALRRKPFNPIVSINWVEAIAFAHWRSIKENRDWRLIGQTEFDILLSIQDSKSYRAALSDQHEADTLQVVTEPVTIGAFPVGKSGLYDVIANAGTWLATAGEDGLATKTLDRLPSNAYYVGYNYISSRIDDFGVMRDQGPYGERADVGMRLFEVL